MTARTRGDQHQIVALRGLKRHSLWCLAAAVGKAVPGLGLLAGWPRQLAATALNDAEPHVDDWIRNRCGVKALDYGFGSKVANASRVDTDAGQ